jgi:bacteriocin biosynthesis cyclodehydratase domain
MLIALPDNTLVIYAEEFGRQVLAMLDTSNIRTFEAVGPVYTALIPYATRIVSVWSGYRPEDRDRIDSLAFVRGIPSVGVELHVTSLVCGPVVVPGRSACYACYQQRMSQHHEHVQAVMRTSAGLPEGFGPAEVAVAAGFISQAMRDLDQPHATEHLGGEVRLIDLVRGSLHCHETVAVDRCPRCGSRFSRDRHPTTALEALI